MNIFSAFYESPIGTLAVSGSEEGITAIDFLDEPETSKTEPHPSLRNCLQQLDEYFRGQRKKFIVNLLPHGTAFQMQVWDELLKIPFGRTSTYLDIAVALGNRKAMRAVGAANGRNKIPIIIPCHRVIGRDGSLIGFGGGIWRKEFLLKHENALLV